MEKIIVIGHGNVSNSAVNRALLKNGLNKEDVILVDNPESLDFKDIKPTPFPAPRSLPNDEAYVIQRLAERVEASIDNIPKWAKGKKCEKVRAEPKIDRNKPCPCGSNKKAKKCCHG
jgi:hypothetical protein